MSIRHSRCASLTDSSISNDSAACRVAAQNAAIHVSVEINKKERRKKCFEYLMKILTV